MGSGSSGKCGPSCKYTDEDTNEGSVATAGRPESNLSDPKTGLSPKTNDVDNAGKTSSSKAASSKNSLPPSSTNGGRRSPSKTNDSEKGDRPNFEISFEDKYKNSVYFYGVSAERESGEHVPEMLLVYNKKRNLADCRILQRSRVDGTTDWLIDFVGAVIPFQLDKEQEDGIQILGLLRVRVDKANYNRIRQQLDEVSQETFKQAHRNESEAEFVDTYSEPKYTRKYFHVAAGSAENSFALYLYHNEPKKEWTLIVNEENPWFTQCEIVSINQQEVILRGQREGKESSWTFQLEKDKYSQRQVKGLKKSLYELPRYKEIHSSSKGLMVCDWGALEGNHSDRSFTGLE